MKNSIALFSQLAVFLFLVFLLEGILPFISLLFTSDKEFVFLVALVVVNPAVYILFIIYLSKKWKIRLRFRFNDLLSEKLGWVLLITALFYFIVFPFSFPISFSKDFLLGMIQIPVFKLPNFSGGFNFWLLLHSVVIAPVVEEILFRGVIQKRIRRDFSPQVSILFASIVFAICHFSPSRLLHHFLGGLFFGVLFQKYKSLSLSIVAHALINLLAFLFVRMGLPQTNQLALYSLVLLFCGFGLFLVNKKLKLID